MSVLSNSIVMVRFPSGNRGVYAVQPQHMNLQHFGATLNQSAIAYGQQLAVEFNGQWYRPGGQDRIDEVKTVALLERAIQAWEN